MEAIVVSEFGGPDQLQPADINVPEPRSGEARIAVSASGVHHVDVVVRTGEQLGPFPLPPLPYVPGREVAGIVDAVGPGGDESLIGRAVAVSLGNANGGYARQALAPIDQLHLVSDNLDPATAVALVGTGRTAVGMLDGVSITPDDVVLVTAAGGGVGSTFVQLARTAGATVVALAGGQEKLAVATEFGAAYPIDYRDDDWPNQVRELPVAPTLLLDAWGGPVAENANDLLAPGGRLVLFKPGPDTIAALAERGLTVSPPDNFALAKVFDYAEEALARGADGTLRARLTRFDLADAAEAHRALSDRATVGKVVLV